MSEFRFGDAVVIDCPGSPWHGQVGTVVGWQHEVPGTVGLHFDGEQRARFPLENVRPFVPAPQRGATGEVCAWCKHRPAAREMSVCDPCWQEYLKR